MSRILFARNFRCKSKLTTTIQSELFGRWFNPFNVANKKSKHFFHTLDFVHFTLSMLAWIYFARWYSFFFLSWTSPFPFYRFLSLCLSHFFCTSRNHIKWLEVPSTNMKNVIFEWWKPIEKFTWHRHFCDVDRNEMWFPWSYAHSTYFVFAFILRATKHNLRFVLNGSKEVSLFCARIFFSSFCAFLRLFFVCISRWVCYLFSPSNYITLRVSICWQRKCIRFNVWGGEK